MMFFFVQFDNFPPSFDIEILKYLLNLIILINTFHLGEQYGFTFVCTIETMIYLHYSLVKELCLDTIL